MNHAKIMQAPSNIFPMCIIYTPDTPTSFISSAETTSNYTYTSNTHTTRTSTTQLHYSHNPGRTTETASRLLRSRRSTNSDDNNDLLSWQALSGRSKERTGPRTTKVPRMKKTTPQETTTKVR
jgi:hypothetical protein